MIANCFGTEGRGLGATCNIQDEQKSHCCIQKCNSFKENKAPNRIWKDTLISEALLDAYTAGSAVAVTILCSADTQH